MSEWQPIETAPKGVNDICFMRLAWPNGDEWSTADGIYYHGKFYAASAFYNINSDRKYQFREHEVNPTHWMYNPEPPEDNSNNVFKCYCGKTEIIGRYGCCKDPDCITY